MKNPTLNLTLILAAALPVAAQNDPGWRTDPRHPDLEFQVKCRRETATILWRSRYKGEVTLEASVRSSTYDGSEHVTVAPGGTAETPLETEYCSPTAFVISVPRFSMAPPPPPPAPEANPASAADATKAPAPKPPALVIPPYQPPQKLPTVPVEAVTSIQVGADRDQVLRKLGQPASGIIIPDDNELRETLRYNLPDDQSAVIRLSNGVVVEVSIP